MSLGTQIKMHRDAHGYTLTDLSRLAGLARSFIWAIEQGRAEPTASKLLLLSRALQVPIDVLLEVADSNAEALKGKQEVWAQGACVKYVVTDPAVATFQYRLDMRYARIGISTHLPDGIRVQELTAEISELRRLLGLSSRLALCIAERRRGMSQTKVTIKRSDLNAIAAKVRAAAMETIKGKYALTGQFAVSVHPGDTLLAIAAELHRLADQP